MIRRNVLIGTGLVIVLLCVGAWYVPPLFEKAPPGYEPNRTHRAWLRGIEAKDVDSIELDGPTVSTADVPTRVITDKSEIARILSALKKSARITGTLENKGGYMNVFDRIVINARTLLGKREILFEIPTQDAINGFGPDVDAMYKTLRVRGPSDTGVP